MSAQLLTIREAADRLRVSKRTVEQLLSNGEIGTVRIGRSVRIAEHHLEQFVAAHDRPAMAPVIALHPAGTALHSTHQRARRAVRG